MFPEGEFMVYAVANLDGGDDFVSGNLIVDRTAPNLEFTIPDLLEGNMIYSEDFLMKFITNDLHNLDRVELYVDSYNHNVFTYFISNNTYINTSRVSGNFNNWASLCNGNRCESDNFMFINGTLNETYELFLKSYDIFGNVNISNIKVTLKDGVSIIIQDTYNAKVSSDRLNWLTKMDAPIISFNTTREAKCFISPMVDSQWNIIVGPGTTAKSFDLGTGKSFTIDLSSSAYLGFNLSKKIDLSSNVSINCIYNGKNYPYRRMIKSISYLSDYVLNSSSGYVINENPYTTTLEINAVGPYKELRSCSYNIDGGVQIPFYKVTPQKFMYNLDLNSYSGGNHLLTFNCLDALGYLGPTKSYNITILKNTPLSIENVKLVDNMGQNYLSTIDEKIYLNKVGSYELEFNTNLRNNTCSYYLNSGSDSFITGIISYFKHLFGFGYKNIPMDGSFYEYREALQIESDYSSLHIECGSNSLDYNIIIDNSKVNVTSINLN